MKNNVTEQLDDLAVSLGADVTPASNNILEAIEKIKTAIENGSGGGGSSASDWPLSDRMAKGTANGSVVVGEINGEYTNNASGLNSIAEGKNTLATGDCSHAEGTPITFKVTLTGEQGSSTYMHGSISYKRKELAPFRVAKYNGEYYDVVEFVTSEYNGMEQITGITFDRSLNPDTDWTNEEITLISPSYAAGDGSHAEGYGCAAIGDYSHAEGSTCTSTWNASHAEGYGSISSGGSSHAEGCYTEASGDYSHAEGSASFAHGFCSHAEGYETIAKGNSSHAEGASNEANASYSHAEGKESEANGYASHVEGSSTTNGPYSHAEGCSCIASHYCQHVFGEYNVEDPSSNEVFERGTYVEIVGNGTNASNRSNARTLDWEGNEKIAGSLTIGMGTADEVTITPAQLKALLALLN